MSAVKVCRWLVALYAFLALPNLAQGEPMIEIVGRVYCRKDSDSGERPWGGVRVQLKDRSDVSGETDPEHGTFRLRLPESEAMGRQLTLVYTQSNLKLGEGTHAVEHDNVIVLAGHSTVEVSPRVFEVPYCIELEAPRLREMVRALIDRMSHRSAVVHSELVRSHAWGSQETAECLDSVLSRMGAHLREAESRWAPFLDALGEDGVRARREVNRIKIADERAQELSAEADYCLEHHSPHPGADSRRYLPDLQVSPSGTTVTGNREFRHPAPFGRPVLSPVGQPGAGRFDWVPSASFETGYDSNFLQAQGNAVVKGWQFRPLAHLALRYSDSATSDEDGAELVQPRAEGRLSLMGLLLTGVDGGSLSRYSDLGVVADGIARFPGDSGLSGLLYGSYQRRVEPGPEPEYQFTLGQNELNVGGDLDFTVGQGRFDLGAGYTLGVVAQDYSSDVAVNRLGHRLVLHERLRFLPETAWVHETEVRLRSYTESTSLSDSQQLRSRLGLVGMFQDRLGFTALGGWAMSQYGDKNPNLVDFDGLLAHVSLEWFMGSVALASYRNDRFGRPSIAVSYDRDFRDDVVVDYYRRDRGSLSLSLNQNDAWFWQIEGGLSNIAYASFVDNAGAVGQGSVNQVTSSDSELRVDIEALAEYRIIDGLRAMVRFAYARAVSDVVPVAPDGTAWSRSLGYERFQLMTAVRWLR